jgi:DHA2 family multidrug resistance protein
MWHQEHLQNSMQAGSNAFAQHQQALSGFLGGAFGAANSGALALASIYNQLNAQAQMQGYQDVYMELSWMSFVLVFMAFLLSANRPGQGPGPQAMH